MNIRNISYVLLITCLILITIRLCSADINSRTLEPWDEQTNIEVVTQTLGSANLILPVHKSGYFLEKPPLWYWVTMVSVRIFGMNNFSFRLVSSISGILIIWLVYVISKTFNTRLSGMLSFVSILTITHLYQINPGGYFSTHTFNSADADGLNLFLITAVWYLLLIYDRNGKLPFLIIAGLMSGLSVLTKGPIGLIPAIVYFTYRLIVNKRFRILEHVLVFTGVLFSVSIPWHAYMYRIAGDEFTRTYINYHLISRVITQLEGHNGPVYYYLPILINPIISGIIPISFIAAITGLFRKKFLLNFYTFSQLMIPALILIIVTLAKTKLAWYILGVYPFMSTLTGDFLAGLIKPEHRKK